MQKQRVVITGAAMVNAIAHDVTNTWQGICHGITGIASTTDWPTEVNQPSLVAAVKNKDACRARLDRKTVKMISKHDILGLSLLSQLMEETHWIAHRESVNKTEFNDTTGIYVGSSGNKLYQQYDFLPLLAESNSNLRYFADHLRESVSPLWLLQTLQNNVLAHASMQYGFKGANHNIVNHGVSGLQAIIEAFYAIQSGQINRALVIAHDTMFDAQIQPYYAALGVLSKTGVRPFDSNRDGTIPGEGAAALTLETYDEAIARGATIIGEVLAGATTSEAAGVFAIKEEGLGVARAMQSVLEKTSLQPASLGMISAHGNGTPLSDQSEAAAIKAVLQKAIVPVTSYKWALGHTLAAAGVMETILSLRALQEKNVPGIATLKAIAKECEGISVSTESQAIQSPYAAIISRGFGSLASCLLVKVFA